MHVQAVCTRIKVNIACTIFDTIVQRISLFFMLHLYVPQYMHDNENKVYIDVNDMADALQKRYRDYRGKKRGPFRSMVRQAYDELTKIFSNKSSMRECSVYDDDDFEDVDVEVPWTY